MPRSTSPFFRAALILGVAVLLLTIGPASVRADSQTFTVINTNDSGAGSLRQAMLNANANAGTDTIAFNIPGAGVQTIAPTSALPEITDPVIIDGYTQPGTSCAAWPPTLLIELNGQSAGFPVNGLYFSGGSGTSQVSGLVINRFSAAGIAIGGAKVEAFCNFLGTNTAGTAALPNYIGIGIDAATNNLIGGATPTKRNLVSGNQDGGIVINGAASSANQIQGNYIGVAVSGNAALPNGRNGVLINESPGNFVTDNVIAANTGDGVDHKTGAANGNTLSGNKIGVGADGTTVLGNGEHGIEIDGAKNTLVSNNVIANNAQSGIAVVQNTSVGNRFEGNQIFNNGAIGIDLNEDGPTPNDDYDDDTGPNGLQNFPDLETVVTNRTTTLSFSGSIRAAYGNGTIAVTIHFFASSTCDPTGYGEGQTYLGFIDQSLNYGDHSFSGSLPVNVAAGQFITATATTTAGTSEFSPCFAASSPPFVVANTNDSGVGSLRQAILDANVNPGLDEIHFNIPGAGVHTITPTSALPYITDPVIIDGYTQPGTSPATESAPATLLIELTGTPFTMLYVMTIDSTFRGLVINRWGSGYGVQLFGGGNKIEGCYIGTDPSGDSMPSGQGGAVAGIGTIPGGNNNVIGGLTPAMRNVISGARATYNLMLAGEGNIVQGNYIGLNATGTRTLGEVFSNVAIGRDHNLLGGTTPGARNVISAARGLNVLIEAANNNTLQGNYIGTDATGTIALSSASEGVLIYSKPDQSIPTGNIVGGTEPGARNVISGNGGGVTMHRADNTQIVGNYIGLDSTGTQPLGNVRFGVGLGGAQNTVVGGTTPEAANRIAYNGIAVVVVDISNMPVPEPFRSSLNNRILGNAIWGSTGWAEEGLAGLGVNLADIDQSGNVTGDVTPNDPGDADTGPNGFQNFPVLAHALTNTTSTLTVTGSLNSKADTLYRIEFFSNQTCDPTGYGEGETYLGYTEQTTNSGGDVNFSVSLNAAVPLGRYITATATGPEGTSEFSLCAQTQTALFVTNTDDSGAGSLRQAILDANANPGLDAIHFNIPGAGVHTIAPTSALPEIYDPVIIDGYTQPGTSPATESSPATLLIELQQNYDPGLSNQHGVLTLSSENSTIRGLVINRARYGIVLLANGNNTIEGNHIAVNPAGDGIPGGGETGCGIRIDDDSHGNKIGGLTPAARNVISGAIVNIQVDGSDNIIQGNYLGLNASGNAPLETHDTNVRILGDRNVIGGTVNGARNVITASYAGYNMYITGNDNVVQGNYIGTDATGSVGLRSMGGVVIAPWIPSQHPNGNIIGGTVPEARNIISGHQYVPAIEVAWADGNRIEGNYIGLNATGTAPIGNMFGVYLYGARDNVVGGSVPGAANRIANNGIGVIISDSVDRPNYPARTSYNNRILGNTIWSNTPWQPAQSVLNGIGINLTVADQNGYPTDSVTPNDPGDMDSGANGFQNFPVLAHALTNTTSSLTVTGSLNSKPDTLYRIEFFSNQTCDPSGYGEGETYLGYTEQTTNSGGDVNFSVSLSAAVPVGRYITATATGPEGTSEFSLCRVTGSARPDTVGIYRPSNTTFYLRNSNTTGPADITAAFGQTNDQPVAGDWDGDGIDTIGVYRTTTGTFFLKNANTTVAPVVYTFTLGNPGDLPMAGDWNGDGIDGAGVFRPTNGRLYLKNALTTGFADFAMVLGVNGDRPVAGDWNGDGSDSPGVYRPSNSRFYLTNQRCNCIVYADYQLLLGNVGDVGFAGDWNADGISGVGVFRPTNGRTYLKNALTTGFADVSMIYGIANDRPVAGKWIAAGSAPQQAPEFVPGR